MRGGKVLRAMLPDVRDVFVFGGLALMGYGLWLYRPWVAYAACGLVLLLLGLVPPPAARARAARDARP